MGRDVLSVRQMMVLLVVSLLAPATDLLPTIAAQQVGQGGWLVPLGALPILLLAFWVCGKVFCGNGLCNSVGKPVGYTFIIIYLIWILVALAAALRLSAARMELVGSNVPPVLLAVVPVALAVWMGMGKVSAFARAVEVFYLALSVVLAGILLLALFQMEWENFCPVAWKKLPGGGLATAGVFLNVAPAAVLGTRVPKDVRSIRRSFGWIAAFCVAAALVLAAVLGCVGSGLSARLQIPYLIMVQGLGIKGGFQRTEGLIAALWLLSDVCLMGVLLQAWKSYIKYFVSEKWSRRSIPFAAAGALIAGWVLFSSADEARVFSVEMLPAVGLLLGLMVPVLLQLIMGMRGRKKG